jgi:hypothetical protein
MVDRRYRFPHLSPGKAAMSLGANPLSCTSKQDANAACKILNVLEASTLDGLLANAGVEQGWGSCRACQTGALRLVYRASSPR